MSIETLIDEWRGRGYCVAHRPPFVYVFLHPRDVDRVNTETGKVDHVTELPADVWRDLFQVWLEKIQEGR